MKTHEKLSLVIILAEFCRWQIKMKHDEKVMSVIRPSTASTYSFTNTPVTKSIDGVPKVSKTKKVLTKAASDKFCLLTKRTFFQTRSFAETVIYKIKRFLEYARLNILLETRNTSTSQHI